jgi:hypothetical protein
MLEAEEELRAAQSELDAIKDELKRRREDTRKQSEAAEKEQEAEAAAVAAESLEKAQAASRKKAEKTAAELEPKATRRLVLEILYETQKMLTAPQMMNSSGMSRNGMYTSLKELEGRGLVKSSVRPGERVKRWHLTAAGEDVCRVLYGGDRRR